MKEIPQEGQLSSFAVMIAPQAGQRLRFVALVKAGITICFGLVSGPGCCMNWA
jgi:hypothetical protein